MPEPVFLALEDILFIHQQEIQISGSFCPECIGMNRKIHHDPIIRFTNS